MYKREVDYDYNFKMTCFNSRKVSSKADIQKETKIILNDRVSVGDFIINLHAYDRSTDKLKASNINRKDLSEWCGVSVYRDGIRIMPYGEKGNDWLNLDNRRIQNPGERIGNDQVIGMIEINQDTNIHLKDKTNREGLIEDEYYDKFCALIFGAFLQFLKQSSMKTGKK